MKPAYPDYLDPQQQKRLRAYFERSLTVDTLPACVVIESTNCCNLDCIMCPRGTMTRRVGIMDPALFRRVIDQLVPDTEFIYLHFFGEPLLHEGIFELIEYASGKGITVAMSTNATLLDEAAADALIASKLGLLILSVDSLQRETYESIRRGGAFDRVLTNVNRFIQRFACADETTLSVAVQMIRMAGNENETRRFASVFGGIPGVYPIVKPLDDYAGQYGGADELGAQRCEDARTQVCGEPWKTLVVGHDGVVVPCHNDYDYKCVLGDLNRQSVQEVWNGDAMRAFRKMHVEGRRSDSTLCSGCSASEESFAHGISLLSRFRAARSELQAYFHKGLYPFESGGPADHLWTQREFELLLQDRFQDTRLVLCNRNPARNALTLGVRLFGKPYGRCTFRDRAALTLQTPPQYAGRLLRYSFSLSDDWCPAECGIGTDTRRLGVDVAFL
ncbi:MAG: radical SAM protein [Polyangiaceae bacterium]|nr:radical SAM protein [Polyangiaceae bacterium]